jgi:hypothetical protein
MRLCRGIAKPDCQARQLVRIGLGRVLIVPCRARAGKPKLPKAPPEPRSATEFRSTIRLQAL